MLEAGGALLYGGFGYRALLVGLSVRLKKKTSLCRYCDKLMGVLAGLKGYLRMSKRELIDYICEINRSAKAEFLSNFSEDELKIYLEHLMELDLEELTVCS